MESFLKEYFPHSKIQTEKLPGDGGHRSYLRVKSSEKKTYILMLSGEKDESLKHFLSVHKKLDKAGCRVPEVFHQNLEKGFLLMEDLKDQTLENLHLERHFQFSEKFYKQSIKQLIKLQSAIPKGEQDTVFDKQFFLEEVDMSIHHLEKIISNSAALKNLRADFKKQMTDVISQLINTDYFYCHRDFHSRNMMVLGDDLCLLDFQDAGMGPQVYDLTSLVYDSYIELSETERKNLVDFYFENAYSSLQMNLKTSSDLYTLVELQFLQRGLKACGCFAKFFNENNKKTHLKYISSTFHHLLEVSKKHEFSNLNNYFETFLKAWKQVEHTL